MFQSSQLPASATVAESKPQNAETTQNKKG
nr:MAG TPA: hypothetical protein [Caudoviricetes sp.]